MDARGYQMYQQYEKNTVNDMTQGELLLYVFEGLVKQLKIAELTLKQKDYEHFEKAVDKSSEIIRYLTRTLDRKYEIGQQLYRLYDFLLYELSRVKAGRKEQELQRVMKMVGELQESFKEAEKTGGR